MDGTDDIGVSLDAAATVRSARMGLRALRCVCFPVASKELKANACHALLRIIGSVSLMEDVDETQPNKAVGGSLQPPRSMQEQAEKKVAWNKGSTATAQAQGGQASALGREHTPRAPSHQQLSSNLQPEKQTSDDDE